MKKGLALATAVGVFVVGAPSASASTFPTPAYIAQDLKQQLAKRLRFMAVGATIGTVRCQSEGLYDATHKAYYCI